MPMRMAQKSPQDRNKTRLAMAELRKKRDATPEGVYESLTTRWVRLGVDGDVVRWYNRVDCEFASKELTWRSLGAAYLRYLRDKPSADHVEVGNVTVPIRGCIHGTIAGRLYNGDGNVLVPGVFPRGPRSVERPIAMLPWDDHKFPRYIYDLPEPSDWMVVASKSWDVGISPKAGVPMVVEPPPPPGALPGDPGVILPQKYHETLGNRAIYINPLFLGAALSVVAPDGIGATFYHEGGRGGTMVVRGPKGMAMVTGVIVTRTGRKLGHKDGDHVVRKDTRIHRKKKVGPTSPPPPRVP